MNGFVSWSNTVCSVCLLPLLGGCLHGDSSEIQRGDNAPGLSPQERPPWVGSVSPAGAPKSSPRRTRRIKLSEELTDFVPNSPFYDTAPPLSCIIWTLEPVTLKGKVEKWTEIILKIATGGHWQRESPINLVRAVLGNFRVQVKTKRPEVRSGVGSRDGTSDPVLLSAIWA